MKLLQISLWGWLLQLHFIFKRSSHDFDRCLIGLSILGVALKVSNALSWKSSWSVSQFSFMATSVVATEHLLHYRAWAGEFELCYYHSLASGCYSDLDWPTSAALKPGWVWSSLWSHATWISILTFQACRPLSTCMYLRKAQGSLDRRLRSPSRVDTSLGRRALGTFPC